MFIKVIYPYSYNTRAEVYQSNDNIPKGSIVVVKRNNKEKLGIVYGIFDEIPPFDKVDGLVVREADSIDKFDFYRLLEKRLLKDGVKLSDEAYEQYKLTNGNENTPREVAEKKITRNLLLSYKSSRIYLTNSKIIGLQYGAMRMFYRNGIVHKIENYCKAPQKWKKSEVSYTYFSKLLGIEGL